MKPQVLLVNEKEGTFIDRRWNFHIADNHILRDDRLACSLHYHSFFELEIPYDGEATHFLNDVQCHAKPGNVYLLRYFDAHRYECAADKGVRIYNLIFNSAALPEEILVLLTEKSGNLACCFGEEDFSALLADVRFLIEGQKKPSADPVDIYMMRTVFTKVILTILKKCLADGATRGKQTGTPFHGALQQIQCRFREPVTLKEIAKAVGVTPNYLGQLFLRHFNISFSEYLRKIRLEYARNMLHFYDHSVEQVAALSGFATDSHFISCFKAAYGMTPRQYKVEKQQLSAKEAL